MSGGDHESVGVAVIHAGLLTLRRRPRPATQLGLNLKRRHFGFAGRSTLAVSTRSNMLLWWSEQRVRRLRPLQVYCSEGRELLAALDSSSWEGG